jgi:alpha-galactosidase
MEVAGRPTLAFDVGDRRVVVGPVTAGLVYGPGRLTHRTVHLEADPSGAYVDERRPLRVSLRVRTDHRGASLDLAVKNTGSEPVQLWGMNPFDVGGAFLTVDGRAPDTGEWSMFRNGYQSWSGTGSLRMDEPDRDPPLSVLQVSSCNPAHPASGRAGLVRSELLSAVDTGRGITLGVGFVTSGRQLSSVTLDARDGAQRRLTASCDLDGVWLEPGEITAAETLRIVVTDSAEGALALLADELGRSMHARVPETPPSGWCSWYYYFTKVTQADVEENLSACVGLRESIDLDYVMVDDGHQEAIGDWLETNAKFPDGMAALAGKINAAGFDAGIWLAPFLADPESHVARTHPDWILRRDGKPVIPLWNPGWAKTRPMWALDTSHPEVLAWLTRLARTVRRDWGYRILKLDFLYAVTLDANRHDPRSTRGDALRRGLEAIRDGAGDDAFLLGCGCPLGPAVGIVDGMRIGQDVTPWWSLPVTRTLMRDRHGLATKHAIRNTLARAFMHGRLWANDPDCLLVRERKSRLSIHEVRSLASVIGLTDGMFVLSDRLADLGEDRLEMIRLARRMSGAFSSVPDLFARDLPETLVARPAGQPTLMVANFSDKRRTREVDLAVVCPDLSDETELVDVWTGTCFEVRAGTVTVEGMASHSCVVLQGSMRPSL